MNKLRSTFPHQLKALIEGSNRKVIVYRFVAPAVALAIFLSFSALYVFDRSETYYHLLGHWGIVPFTFPFIDATGGLAAWECTRLGISVVEHDPCDVLGRAYYYSPLWMYAASIPLGVPDTTTAGFILGLLFLLSLALLPPPRTLSELVLMVLAATSTMVVYAVERGNPDLVVFLLTMIVGFVVLRASARHLLSYPVVLFAALSLKYYPIMLRLISLRS